MQNVRLVHDSRTWPVHCGVTGEVCRMVRLYVPVRTREMLRGITMEDAELTLNPLRPGHDSTKGRETLLKCGDCTRAFQLCFAAYERVTHH